MDVDFIFENCGCQVQKSYGLPCAHEQFILVNEDIPLELELVDKFWKKLDLLECTSSEDNDLSYDIELSMFSAQFKSKSRFGKLNLIKQFRSIVAPSTTSVCEPAVQKTTRGRRSANHKNSREPHIDLNQTPPTEDPPTQEPETYTRYSFPRDSLIYEISNEFHEYVHQIYDVVGDGNCGFRAIAMSLGYAQDYWPQIRSDLYNELLEHPIEYGMLYDYDFESIKQSLNFYGLNFAPIEHHLIMPATSFLIANKYGVIVHFLSKQGSSTCFPLWRGPQDIPDPGTVAIAHVYGGHYVKVDLQGEYTMPTILPLWHHYRFNRSTEWETMYSDRLNAYIPPNAPRNNYNIPSVVIPDD